MSSRAVAAVESPVRAALARLALRRAGRVLLALSGGADSVALLHVLARLRKRGGFDLLAAHFNHRLRGDESDRDEEFVRGLCARLEVDLIVRHAGRALRGKGNLEERARRLRYAFLNRAADQAGADYIALAHNADDQAETVLMRFLRGAGVAGLSAMTERGPARLLRPLLTVERAAIERYLRAIGADYVSDSTNQNPAFLRNRIRLELIPLIEREFAAGLRGRLTGLAREAQSLDWYLTELARAELSARSDNRGLNLSGFSALPRTLAERVIREYLREQSGSLRRISRRHCEAIIRLASSENPAGSVLLPGDRILRRDYGRAVITPNRAKTAQASVQVCLKVPGRTEIPACGFAFEARMSDRRGCPEFRSMPQNAAIFDADAAGPLVVRNFQQGDRINPLGMRGARKLQDVFVDRKLPKAERRRWPLVISGGEIVWAPAMVRGNRALVTRETKKILYLEAIPMSEAASCVVA